jgi:5'(3')-deoxyribonucleotidase
MALKIGVDVDGVLADFRGGFTQAVHAVHGETTGPADPATSWSDRLSNRELDAAWKHISRTPNWWTTLKAYEPAQVKRLYELSRERRWEVFFLTRRPATAGEPVQYQTQWWIEQQGFVMPSVLTVPGSRGELSNALRLDIVLDDQLINCVEVVSASTAKAVLVLRSPADPLQRDHATARGIGTVALLQQAVDVLTHLESVIEHRRGKLLRLTDWFKTDREGDSLPPLQDRPSLDRR